MESEPTDVSINLPGNWIRGRQCPSSLAFILFAVLMSVNCFGENAVGGAKLFLTVRPEARIFVQDISNEIRPELGVEIHWVRVELTLRMPMTGTTSLWLHSPNFANNYVIVEANNQDQSRVTESGSVVILRPTRNGRFCITIGISRSLDQSTTAAPNAVLELKSSDELLNISKTL